MNLGLAGPGNAAEQKEGPRRSRPHAILAVGDLKILKGRSLLKQTGAQNSPQALCRQCKCPFVPSRSRILETSRGRAWARALPPVQMPQTQPKHQAVPVPHLLGGGCRSSFALSEGPTESRPLPRASQGKVEKRDLAALPTGPGPRPASPAGLGRRRSLSAHRGGALGPCLLTPRGSGRPGWAAASMPSLPASLEARSGAACKPARLLSKGGKAACTLRRKTRAART